MSDHTALAFALVMRTGRMVILQQQERKRWIFWGPRRWECKIGELSWCVANTPEEATTEAFAAWLEHKGSCDV